MAFSVSSLTDYVIENENLLLMKSLFSGKTADLVMSEGNVMTGVKFSEKINILATDAIFQDGAGCTRTSSGTTSVTQRTVTVGSVAVVEDLCIKDLEKKYLSKALPKGANYSKVPFEQEYTDLKTGTINEEVEMAMWQGDTTSGNANLSRFDGYVKLIDAAAASVNGNPTSITTGTGITASNIISIVTTQWQKIPARVKGKTDVRVFMGFDTYELYIGALIAANLYHYTAENNKQEAGEITIPGTQYKITAVHGLDGTNRIFTLRTSNMFIGTDLENEEEKWSIMPDQFKDYLRFKAQFKYGVNVAFPDEIVQFKLV